MKDFNDEQYSQTFFLLLQYLLSCQTFYLLSQYCLPSHTFYSFLKHIFLGEVLFLIHKKMMSSANVCERAAEVMYYFTLHFLTP